MVKAKEISLMLSMINSLMLVYGTMLFVIAIVVVVVVARLRLTVKSRYKPHACKNNVRVDKEIRKKSTVKERLTDDDVAFV